MPERPAQTLARIRTIGSRMWNLAPKLLAPGPLAVVFLALAVAAVGAAWQLQASAGADLRQAAALQAREVPDPGGDPPDIADYEAILEELTEAIRVRQKIESRLVIIEDTVALLNQQRTEGVARTSEGAEALADIGASLGAAVEAARASRTRLDGLESRLEVSARLARLIAEELEELDRRLGPSADR